MSAQPQIQVKLLERSAGEQHDNAKPNNKRVSISVGPLSPQLLDQLKAMPTDQLIRVLQLHVKQAYDDGIRQAVFARLALDDGQLTLEPRFELQSGTRYLVRYELPGNEPLSEEIVLGGSDSPAAASVEKIYPTAEILPQNLLKFYIYFDQPMAQGEAYQHILLASSDGQALEHPFLEIDEELWDRSGKRLTLILDPSRVKRGLVPREEDGPVLTAGMRYVLTIKSSWPAASGAALRKSFTKKFIVGPEDFTQPNPAHWQLTSPKAKTLDPITIQMPEPVDHATFMRGVTIENSQGEVIRGEITFAQHETRAYFRPLKPWRAGLFDLCVSPLVEDLSGNSIERAFEIDRVDAINRPTAARKMLTIEIQK